jgi:hypothetical protein
MSGRQLWRVAAAGLLLSLMTSGGAEVQTSGGILRIYHRDSPSEPTIIAPISLDAVALALLGINHRCMRVSVCNWQTSEDDVDRAVRAVQRVLGNVSP